MKTYAFKNKKNFWSTKYSFDSPRYVSFDRTFYSFKNIGMWKHGPHADAEKTSYYGEDPAGSRLSFSFNENVSANKIYKNFSLEGSFNQEPTAAFIANNSSKGSQKTIASIRNFVEKGAHLHAQVGRSPNLTRANFQPVGVLKRIHQVYFPEVTAPGMWNEGTLLDAIQGGVENIIPYNLDNGIADHNALTKETSRYCFLEMSFFPGYKPSASETKYLMANANATGLFGNSVADKLFSQVNAPFNSYQGQCAKAMNKALGDFRGKSYSDGNVQYNNQGFSVNGKSRAEGLVVYVDQLNSFSPEGTYRKADFDQDGAVTTIDLLLFLTAYGAEDVQGTSNEPFDLAGGDDYSAGTITDISGEVQEAVYNSGDGNISTADLLEFLTQFGLETQNSGEISVDGVVDILNATLDIPDNPTIIYAVTPGAIDGESARGTYADVTLTLKGDFELDVVNLEYQPTNLDHSR